ncbi:hypothetical protein S245_056933 [Arachis hypogaea]
MAAKRDNNRYMNVGKVTPLVLVFLFFLVSLFSFFILFYSPNASTVLPNQRSDETDESLSRNNDEEEVDISEPNTPSENQYEERTCDLFKGHWVPTTSEGSTYYTNSSCRTIPDSKNCFKHGRTDSDFLNWRWKPEQCDLPRFDHKMFLELVRGKKMAFIGDSVSRNHMESLLCLLSQEVILCAWEKVAFRPITHPKKLCKR